MQIVKRCNKNELPETDELNLIYNNIKLLDHHDCVRTDQIITKLYNSRETIYQWASVCMNQKWKTL